MTRATPDTELTSIESDEITAHELYELALAVTREDTAEVGAAEPVEAYVETLGCLAGLVIQRVPSGGKERFRVVGEARQEETTSETVSAGLEWCYAVVDPERNDFSSGDSDCAATTDDDSSATTAERLPLTEQFEEGIWGHLFTLPEFGYLLLVSEREQLVEDVTPELERLNRRFVQSRLTHTGRHNPCSQHAIGGSEYDGVDRRLTRIDGAARPPVSRGEDNESGDRRLPRLYAATSELLTAGDRETVCELAADITTEILGFPRCCVHLYERQSQALEPVAVRGVSDISGRYPRAYTDKQTVVWDAYTSQQTVTISDFASSDERIPDDGTDSQSGITVPLGSHGVLVATSEYTAAFGETDTQLCQMLAGVLTTVLDRVKREHALREVQRTTTSLFEVDEWDRVTDHLVRRIADTFETNYVGFWERETPGSALELAAATDQGGDAISLQTTVDPRGTAVESVLEDGRPRIVHDTSNLLAHQAESCDLASLIIAPVGERGVVAVGSQLDGDFSQVEFEMVHALVASTESALRAVRHREELDVLDHVLTRVLRHNIRNDLGVVRGRAKHLADVCTGQRRTEAEDIVDTADRVLSTAESAKQFRDAVAQREQQFQFELESVVDRAVDDVAERFPSAELSVDHGVSQTVVAHPHLCRALIEAIENGVKHSSDRYPRVSVSTDATETGVVVRIADDGPGIPSSELEPVESESVTQISHSSGLGLWLLTRVVEYSHGTVEFTVENGTTVEIRLDDATVHDELVGSF